MLRRPAVHGGGTLWERGLEGPLCDVPPLALGPGCSLVVTEGDYFGAPAQIAGSIIKARGGGWRGVGAPEGERDYERGCAESIHSPPSATLPVSHLPEGMRQADNRGLPVTLQ